MLRYCATFSCLICLALIITACGGNTPAQAPAPASLLLLHEQTKAKGTVAPQPQNALSALTDTTTKKLLVPRGVWMKATHARDVAGTTSQRIVNKQLTQVVVVLSRMSSSRQAGAELKSVHAFLVGEVQLPLGASAISGNSGLKRCYESTTSAADQKTTKRFTIADSCVSGPYILSVITTAPDAGVILNHERILRQHDFAIHESIAGSNASAQRARAISRASLPIKASPPVEWFKTRAQKQAWLKRTGADAVTGRVGEARRGQGLYGVLISRFDSEADAQRLSDRVADVALTTLKAPKLAPIDFPGPALHHATLRVYEAPEAKAALYAVTWTRGPYVAQAIGLVAKGDNLGQVMRNVERMAHQQDALLR